MAEGRFALSCHIKADGVAVKRDAAGHCAARSAGRSTGRSAMPFHVFLTAMSSSPQSPLAMPIHRSLEQIA
ncbi:hypothetical protein [Falsiroseomonas tokyonensis]|uniref:Uncharacterized protein n=1 Tax=Falsiroseomonas tokyonensis TaxID=430521 RepID=A0ABV7C5J4_9PROT|nr:hypothetical protein [Falsiroseomonas tokyonensis]MBU8541451.1 hypothetical protein [Falsiroseomonas tokyonensis]